jgi:tetratricopeptide (TPR) repeat protein
MKKALYFLLLLAFSSCDIFVTEVMTNFTVTIYMKGPIIGQNENDRLPSYIIKFLQPIEFGDSIFIPEVKIIRTDLTKEAPLKLQVPMSTENSIKKTLGTYDYSCLKDDYDQNIPSMTLGKYLVMQGSESENPITTNFGSDALVYDLPEKNSKIIEATISQYASLIRKNGFGKVVIILSNDNASNSFKSSQGKDQRIYSLINEADQYFNSKDYEKAVTKYNEVLAIDPNNSLVNKRLIEIKKITTITTTTTVVTTKTTQTDNSTETKADKLSANSLKEYFDKIADTSVSYKNKDKLKSEVISNYFAGEDAIVEEMGPNNTPVSHTKIKEFIEELSQLSHKIEIIKSEANSQNKITKLFIKEL